MITFFRKIWQSFWDAPDIAPPAADAVLSDEEARVKTADKIIGLLRDDPSAWIDHGQLLRWRWKIEIVFFINRWKMEKPHYVYFELADSARIQTAVMEWRRERTAEFLRS